MTKVVKMTNREILENAIKRLDKAGIAEAGMMHGCYFPKLSG